MDQLLIPHSTGPDIECDAGCFVMQYSNYAYIRQGPYVSCLAIFFPQSSNSIH